MPDSSLTLEMMIKEGRAVIGLNRVAEAETKVERAAAGITKEAKKADRELEQFAKRTTQINATPIERYRQQIERLDTALGRGKITHETYARAVFRAGVALHDVRRAQQESLGERFLGQIGAYTAGYLSLSRAVQVVGDAFRHARQESEGALSSLRGLDDPRRKLAQLATDMPPGALAAMQGRADKAAADSGASRSTAYEVLFQAHSYGFEKNYEQVMGMNPIIDASAASTIAGKIRLMTGSKRSPQELVAGLIEAGKPSEVDAETLSGPMSIALEGGRRIGANPEETMALLSSMTKYYAGRGENQGEGRSGAARVAGDRMRAFAHKVATRLPELRGQGFIKAFEAVRNMSEGDRAEFLKENEEVSSAYESYNESRDTTAAIYQRVIRAEDLEAAGRGNVTRGLALRGADPKSRAAIEVNRAEIAKEIAKETQLGLTAATRETLLSRGEQASYETGQGAFSRGIMAQGTGAAKTMQLEGQAPLAMQAIGLQAASQVNGGAASGNMGFWQWLGQVMTLQLVESRAQTQLLENIANQPGQGGATRAIEGAARAPLN